MFQFVALLFAGAGVLAVAGYSPCAPTRLPCLTE